MKKLFVSAGVLLLSTSALLAQTKGTAKKTSKPATSAATAAKVTMKNLNDSFSYAAGLNIASNMKEQGIVDVNGSLMAKAIDDVFKNRTTALTTEEASKCLQTQLAIYGEAKNAEKNKGSAEELAKGQAFLEANKVRTGVTTLPDGLQYEIIKEGEPSGIKPTAQDTVVVNYIGKLIDGTEFESSVKNGGPVTFPVNGVIKGWVEILQLMTKGAHWKVYIPSELAYGNRDNGPMIRAGAALVFDIMLEDIKPAAVK